MKLLLIIEATYAQRTSEYKRNVIKFSNDNLQNTSTFKNVGNFDFSLQWQAKY
jgi:hypothetical protein